MFLGPFLLHFSALQHYVRLMQSAAVDRRAVLS
jgi:hypothetical protein